MHEDRTCVSGGFRGGSGGSLEPPCGTLLFQFHVEIYEKSGKILETNPLLVNLNPPFRNPGSDPVCRDLYSAQGMTVPAQGVSS